MNNLRISGKFSAVLFLALGLCFSVLPAFAQEGSTDPAPQSENTASPQVIVTPGSIAGADLGDNPTATASSHCSAVVINPPVSDDTMTVDGPHWTWTGVGTFLDDGTATPDPTATGSATFAITQPVPDTDSNSDYSVTFDSPGDYVDVLTATATFHETMLTGTNAGQVITVSYSGDGNPGVDDPDAAGSTSPASPASPSSAATPAASPAMVPDAAGGAAPPQQAKAPKIGSVLGLHYEIIGTNETSQSNAGDAAHPNPKPEVRSHTVAATDSVVDIQSSGVWTGSVGATATPSKSNVTYLWTVSKDAVSGHPTPGYTGPHINAYFEGQLNNVDSATSLGAASSTITLNVTGTKLSYNYGIKWHLPFENYMLDAKVKVNPGTIFSDESPDKPDPENRFPAKAGTTIVFKDRTGFIDPQSMLGAGLIFADLSEGLVDKYTDNPLYLAFFAALKAGGDNIKEKLGEKNASYPVTGSEMFINGMDTKKYGCSYSPMPVYKFTSMGIAHFDPDIGSYDMNNVRMEKVEAATYLVGDAYGLKGYSSPDHEVELKVIKEYPIADFFLHTTNE